MNKLLSSLLIVLGVAMSSSVMASSEGVKSIAVDSQTAPLSTDCVKNASTQTSSGGDQTFKNKLLENHIQLASLKCGLKPLAPVGCKVGSCVCDQYGNNCQWTMICK